MTKEEYWQKQDRDIDEMSHERLKEWTKQLTRASFRWSEKYFQSQREVESLQIEISNSRADAIFNKMDPK